MSHLTHLASLVLALAASACTSIEDVDPEDPTRANGTIGDSGNSYPHFGAEYDPFATVQKLRAEGPPRVASRLRSCRKLRHATLGNLIAALDMTLGNKVPLPSELFTSGTEMLSAPRFEQGQREVTSVSIASAFRMFDIFVAAAPQIIEAVPTLERCVLDGESAHVFDPITRRCRADGLTCILGAPPDPAVIETCNFTIDNASDPTTGQHIAVAVLLAAAFTCE